MIELEVAPGFIVRSCRLGCRPKTFEGVLARVLLRVERVAEVAGLAALLTICQDAQLEEAGKEEEAGEACGGRRRGQCPYSVWHLLEAREAQGGLRQEAHDAEHGDAAMLQLGAAVLEERRPVLVLAEAARVPEAKGVRGTNLGGGIKCSVRITLGPQRRLRVRGTNLGGGVLDAQLVFERGHCNERLPKRPRLSNPNPCQGWTHKGCCGCGSTNGAKRGQAAGGHRRRQRSSITSRQADHRRLLRVSSSRLAGRGS